MADWNDISGAPTDQPVLVYDPRQGICTGISTQGRWWPHPVGDGLSIKPTHWQPLPDKPADD